MLVWLGLLFAFALLPGGTHTHTALFAFACRTATFHLPYHHTCHHTTHDCRSFHHLTATLSPPYQRGRKGRDIPLPGAGSSLTSHPAGFDTPAYTPPPHHITPPPSHLLSSLYSMASLSVVDDGDGRRGVGRCCSGGVWYRDGRKRLGGASLLPLRATRAAQDETHETTTPLLFLYRQKKRKARTFKSSDGDRRKLACGVWFHAQDGLLFINIYTDKSHYYTRLTSCLSAEKLKEGE